MTIILLMLTVVGIYIHIQDRKEEKDHTKYWDGVTYRTEVIKILEKLELR